MELSLLISFLMVFPAYISSQVTLKESGGGVKKPGENLHLTCTVSGFSVTDNNYAVAWIRQSSGKLEWIVHIWGGGNTYYNTALRSRTSITKDTSKNQVSLQLSSLKAEDTAMYYCAFTTGVADYWFDVWGKGTSVTVSSASSSAPTLFPLIPFGSLPESGDVVIGCLAKDFLPDSITFSWDDQNNASLQANKFKTYPSAFNTGGKFTTSTQANISITDCKNKAPFYCKAEHLGVDKVARVICGSNGGSPNPYEPEMIVRAPPLQAFQTAYLNSTITCTATHLISMKTTLQWFKDEEELDSGFTTSKPWFDVHNGNSITSELVVTMKDWFADKKFSCKVENEKYNNTLVIHKSAYGQGPVSCDDVRVETIPPSYSEIHLKQKATLTCRIYNIPYDADLAALNVTWTQKPDNKVLMTVLGKPQEQENDKQTIDATTTVCTTDWNIKNSFSCKVAFAGLLPIPIEKTLQKPSGGSISPPTVYILPPPPEELALRESATVTCMAKNFYPTGFFLQWLHGDQPVSPEHYFISSPRKESNNPERYSAYSTLRINEQDWSSGSSFSCLVGHEGLPLSTTQKTIDKNTGKPTTVNVSLMLSDTGNYCN